MRTAVYLITEATASEFREEADASQKLYYGGVTAKGHHDRTRRAGRDLFGPGAVLECALLRLAHLLGDNGGRSIKTFRDLNFPWPSKRGLGNGTRTG